MIVDISPLTALTKSKLKLLMSGTHTCYSLSKHNENKLIFIHCICC